MPSSSLTAPVIHVGPPKTGTTSLQTSIIPHLGRPFQLKPPWARSIAREAEVRPPGNLPADVIVSHEGLGDFATFPPRVIAARLHSCVPDARVVFVARDPVASFTSFYRQRLVNSVHLLENREREAKLATMGLLKPLSADQLFDRELAHYREDGRGFFAMIRTDAVRRDFAALFEIHTIPFSLLQTNARHFVEAFTDICGVARRPEISHENRTDAAVWTAAIAEVAPRMPPALIAELQGLYLNARLSPGRENFLRRWPEGVNLAALADAFRL